MCLGVTSRIGPVAEAGLVEGDSYVDAHRPESDEKVLTTSRLVKQPPTSTVFASGIVIYGDKNPHIRS